MREGFTTEEAKNVHVLVDRVRNITRPQRLDGPHAAVRTDVAPESEAREHLAQAVDVGAKRERGGQLEILVLEDEREPIESSAVVILDNRRNGSSRKGLRAGIKEWLCIWL